MQIQCEVDYGNHDIVKTEHYSTTQSVKEKDNFPDMESKVLWEDCQTVSLLAFLVVSPFCNDWLTHERLSESGRRQFSYSQNNDLDEKKGLEKIMSVINWILYNLKLVIKGLHHKRDDGRGGEQSF